MASARYCVKADGCVEPYSPSGPQRSDMQQLINHRIALLTACELPEDYEVHIIDTNDGLFFFKVHNTQFSMFRVDDLSKNIDMIRAELGRSPMPKRAMNFIIFNLGYPLKDILDLILFHFWVLCVGCLLS